LEYDLENASEVAVGDRAVNKERLKIVGNELNFTRIKKADVPHGRKGKHHVIVTEIVQDLTKLRPGEALQVPRSAFGDEKFERIRAALNRAVKKMELAVGTASDDDNLYVWVEQ
jgi:hypothetical protein